MATPKVKAVISGIDGSIVEELFEGKTDWEIFSLNTEIEFEDAFDTLMDSSYHIAFCGDLFGLDFPNEFSQTLRQLHTDLNIYFVTTEKAGFQASTFKKNGFSDAFLWPVDKGLASEAVNEAERMADPNAKSFKPIFVTDIDENSVLPFSTYVHMTLNKKYLPFTSVGKEIGEKKVAKLNEKNVGKLYIDKKNMQDFCAYTAERLRASGNESEISQTERNQKVVESVRGLFSEIFDQTSNASIESGRNFVDTSQQIVSRYITNGKSSDFYKSLLSSLGGALNSYDHATTVSSVASLFAIAMNLPNTIDVALAAFFHDIGRSSVPDELVLKPVEEWPEELKATYNSHPTTSVNMLKEKKIVLSPEAEKAIAQHHEKFDGQGFPKQLSGHRISIEAQLLSFSDQLSYLTVLREGEKKLTPQEAFSLIQKNGSIGPELLSQIKKILPD